MNSKKILSDLKTAEKLLMNSSEYDTKFGHRSQSFIDTIGDTATTGKTSSRASLEAIKALKYETIGGDLTQEDQEKVKKISSEVRKFRKTGKSYKAFAKDNAIDSFLDSYFSKGAKKSSYYLTAKKRLKNLPPDVLKDFLTKDPYGSRRLSKPMFITADEEAARDYVFVSKGNPQSGTILESIIERAEKKAGMLTTFEVPRKTESGYSFVHVRKEGRKYRSRIAQKYFELVNSKN
jgi:hypothetical protein